jgi:hypothetical protein
MLKKLILKLAIFFALLIILDMLLGVIIRKIYFKQNHGEGYRTTYVLEKCTSDIIVLGSSKANHHYITSVIQDSMKTSCFNAGLDGHFISFSNAEVNSILKRYVPNIILLDILDDEFEQRSYKIEDRVSGLLPYYKTHPEVRGIVDLKSPLEKYKLLSSLYTFNTLLLPSITGVLDLNNKQSNEKTLGYLPLYGKWSGDIEIIDSRSTKLDRNKIMGLKNIIAACNEKKITLVILVSPSYKKYTQNYNPTITLARKIADSNSVTFWNYLEDTTYLNHKEFFMDIRHLNNDGATIYTTNIIRRLKALK